MAEEPGPHFTSTHREQYLRLIRNEQEYASERDRFAELIGDECGTSAEDAFEMYDTRKVITALWIKDAEGKQLTRDDFILALSLGRSLLKQDDREGIIPFIVRTRKKYRDMTVLRNHPHSSLVDVISRRFIDIEEMEEEEADRLRGEISDDVCSALDFCLEIHKINTDYYRRFPSVGVIFSETTPDKKRFRAGEQANYLTSWRGLPYEISGYLLDMGILQFIDDGKRDYYLKSLIQMGVEELFDQGYFQYPGRPPHIPRTMEFIPRTGPAEQLLHIIALACERDPAVIQFREKIAANDYQQFSPSQLHTLRSIFSGGEETVELTSDQLERIKGITQEKEKPKED